MCFGGKKQNRYAMSIRRRFGNLQLGPPLRPVAGEEDGEIEECDAGKGPSETNKENAKTPVTVPGVNISSCRSSGHRLQESPSSTCPIFWNPGNSTRSKPMSSIGSKLPKTVLHVSNPNGPSSTKGQHTTPVATVRGTVSVNDNTKEEDCNHKGSPSKKPFGSASRHVDPIPRYTTSKPPIDISKSSKTTPNPRQVLFPSPEKQDVVVMPSPNGDYRRFQKLTLVGCGGSSKVCWPIISLRCFLTTMVGSTAHGVASICAVHCTHAYQINCTILSLCTNTITFVHPRVLDNDHPQLNLVFGIALHNGCVSTQYIWPVSGPQLWLRHNSC